MAESTKSLSPQVPLMSDRIASLLLSHLSLLAAFLECDVDDVSEASYGDNQYDAEGGEYLVLTDSEADERSSCSLSISVDSTVTVFVVSIVVSLVSPSQIPLRIGVPLLARFRLNPSAAPNLADVVPDSIRSSNRLALCFD